MDATRVTIVLAWVTMTGVRLTGRTLDRYGLERETVAAPEAKACTWVLEGTAEDVAQARAYLTREQRDAVRAEVYTYPTSEADPLGLARRTILRGVA